jgi:hypothetical protein
VILAFEPGIKTSSTENPGPSGAGIMSRLLIQRTLPAGLVIAQGHPGQFHALS